MAAIRLESEGHVSDCKGRIKALDREDPRPEERCGVQSARRRVPGLQAHRLGAKQGRHPYAVDDHRVLAEEPLPRGTQRTLESAPVSLPEQKESADAIVARLATASDEQLADFAARAKEKGWKVVGRPHEAGVGACDRAEGTGAFGDRPPAHAAAVPDR
jgi:hypothetical protein